MATPGYARGVRRLPRSLSCLRRPQKLESRTLASQRIHNSSLKENIGIACEVEAAFKARLRYPCPQISTVREGGDGQRSDRTWRQRGNEWRILSNHQGCPWPCHANTRRAQPRQT